VANNFADDLETDVLNHFFKVTAAVAQPTNLYLCLFTADPTEAGSTTNEVGTGLGYARQLVSFSAVTTNGTAKQITNNADISFPTATGDWGTVTHGAVVDAASATAKSTVTKWLVTVPLTNSKTIGTGDTFDVPAGSFTIDLD
jgi:hypothetical protein